MGSAGNLKTRSQKLFAHKRALLFNYLFIIIYNKKYNALKD